MRRKNVILYWVKGVFVGAAGFVYSETHGATSSLLYGYDQYLISLPPIHAKIVNLIMIVPMYSLPVLSCYRAGVEHQRASLFPSGLDLNPIKLAVFLDDYVISLIVSEGSEYPLTIPQESSYDLCF